MCVLGAGEVGGGGEALQEGKEGETPRGDDGERPFVVRNVAEELGLQAYNLGLSVRMSSSLM